MRSLLLSLCALLCAFTARCVTLSWDRNPEPNVVAYRVYIGSASRNYTNTFTTTNTTLVVSNAVLAPGTNYFAVTALDNGGLESDFSDEVNWAKKPGAPKNLRLAIIVEQSPDLVRWQPLATNYVTAIAPSQFFRGKE